ncbi:MAG: galactose-1-phosphate uridylyltransferase [Candidatus Omnitrophota bacterium]|nr:galactose-1-phosphate uridylyltransferase [Candidatus Omnitrophota bacterium]
MPELRKDPIIGRWVIIATERAKRPDDFAVATEGPPEGECPFCHGQEHKTPSEVYAVRHHHTKPDTSGWDVRVVSSIKPILKIEGELDRRGKGLFDMMNGVGAHEVVIETPEHIANIADLSEEQITKIIGAYVHRFTDLEKDERFKYLLLFKNYGWSAGGGRIGHSRSQLIATPVNPKRVKEELVGAKKYFEYHERCVFCDLIRQELESKERIVLDLDGIVAIAPFASRFPFEVWIMPKKHSCDFSSINQYHQRELAKTIKIVLSKIKKVVKDPAYNFILHTAPFRRKKLGYWKTIEEDYHWHIEIIPRLTRVAGFEWGTGFYICPLPPESAAKFLRETEL